MVTAPKVWVVEGSRTDPKFRLTNGNWVPRMEYVEELRKTFSPLDMKRLKHRSMPEIIANATSRGWPAFTVDDWNVLLHVYGLDY